MSECPLVLQMYPKQTVKQALGPYMWHTTYSSLHHHLQGKCYFSFQLVGRTKIRVSIKDTSSTHAWLTQVKYEIETWGFNIKNGRTGEPMSHFLDRSHSDWSSSSRSTASVESRGSRTEQKDTARGAGYNFNAVCQRQKCTLCMKAVLDARRH